MQNKTWLRPSSLARLSGVFQVQTMTPNSTRCPAYGPQVAALRRSAKNTHRTHSRNGAHAYYAEVSVTPRLPPRRSAFEQPGKWNRPQDPWRFFSLDSLPVSGSRLLRFSQLVKLWTREARSPFRCASQAPALGPPKSPAWKRKFLAGIDIHGGHAMNAIEKMLDQDESVRLVGSITGKEPG
jgi:hypothetical protein